jgi:hypothetical protein
MSIFRKNQPSEQIPICLRCHVLEVPANPSEWWFLPGCNHNGSGLTAVCAPCKQQIDAGNHVPGLWNCACGAAPILTPIGAGQ